jgi:hypothetical protein
MASPPQKAGEPDHRRAGHDLEDVRDLVVGGKRREHELAGTKRDRRAAEQVHGKHRDGEFGRAAVAALS